VTSRLGTGKNDNLFLQCMSSISVSTWRDYLCPLTDSIFFWSVHGGITSGLDLMRLYLVSTWCDELLISAELVGASVHEAHNAIEDDHMFF
jgi:hypothetical protein